MLYSDSYIIRFVDNSTYKMAGGRAGGARRKKAKISFGSDKDAKNKK